MVDPKIPRQDGKTASEQLAREAARLNEKIEEISEELVVAPKDIEQKRRFRSPNFQRLRVDWNTEDNITLMRAQEAAEKRLLVEFSEVYHILNTLYDQIREPLVVDGKVQRDARGWIIWVKDEFGYPKENWEKLTNTLRDDLLFKITTRLFDWEQKSQAAWTEAMYSKANWEHQFSEAFDEMLSGTVSDREARGRLGSVDERLFAIFLSGYSRRCEALVRSMDRLALRLRDSLK